jgi:hypothetical protein
MSTIYVDSVLNQVSSPTNTIFPVNVNGANVKVIPNNLGENVSIGIGNGALAASTLNTELNNTALGCKALLNCSGDDNTAVGHAALQSITGITANNNTAIGQNAGIGMTGSQNCIFIGRASAGSTPTAANEITLGNSANTVLRCAVTTITSLSDERDKKDIKDLSTGLEFVETLRPVEFTWNDRDENGKHDIADFGFIAQDLKKAQEDAEKAEVLKLVYEENPDKLEASYGKLIPILVKAIQELSEEVKQLKNK